MKTRSGLAFSAVLVAAALAPASRPLGSALVSAQPAVPAQRALIRLEPLALAGFPSSSASGLLERAPSGTGESMTMYLTLVPAGDCFAVGGGGLPAGADVSARVQPAARRWWAVRATLVGADVDRVTAAVEWRHEERADGGVRAVRGGARTLTFHSDQPVILDAMRPDELGAACNDGVFAVTLRGQTMPPAGLEREWVRYDVWLEHRGPEGLVRRHLRDERRHGSRVSFDFAPVRQSAVREGCESEIQVNGAVHALVREDGNLDLVATYGRVAGLAPRGERVRLGAGVGSGGKRLTVRSAEAVRFVLPDEYGNPTLFAGGPCDASGEWVDVQQVFRGQETSVIVQVTRLGAAG